MCVYQAPGSKREKRKLRWSEARVACSVNEDVKGVRRPRDCPVGCWKGANADRTNEKRTFMHASG